MKTRSILACLVILGVVHHQLLAVGSGGIGNEVFSAKSLGQGDVGVAGQSDDPTVTYLNPAGLVNLKETQITFGTTWESVHPHYQSNSGNQTDGRLNDVAVPNAAIGGSYLDGKIGAGLSIESPYGESTHWGKDSPLKYLATDSTLRMMTISPALAYRINPTFSVGAGADYVNIFDADLEKQVNVNNMNTALGFPTTGAPDGTASLKGTGNNWGYHAGILVEPNEHHAIGVTYHSKVVVPVTGSVNLSNLSGTTAAVFGGSSYSSSAWTTLVIPQNIQFGYAYKPNDKWTFEADAAWYDWYANRDLNIRYSETNATRLALLTNSGSGNPTPNNWIDCWSIALGTNYKYSDRMQLRGGVWYVPYASPESTYSPAYNDLNRYGVAIGGGYDVTSNVTIDIAENVVFFGNRVINNQTGTVSTGDPTTNPGGTFSDFANLLTMNITYKFE